MIRTNLRPAAGLAFLSLLAAAGQAADIPTPESVIGFKVGADRKLADWNQIVDYFRKLDAASARVKIDGEGMLNGKSALVEVPMGQGKAVLFGFRPQYRAQSWATYLPMMNAMLLSSATPSGARK